MSTFAPHVDNAIAPMDRLAGDRLTDGDNGHAVQDVVQARAYGYRWPDHAGEDRTSADGLMTGFDGVQNVDDAGLIAGSGYLDIDV